MLGVYIYMHLYISTSELGVQAVKIDTTAHWLPGIIENARSYSHSDVPSKKL